MPWDQGFPTTPLEGPHRVSPLSGVPAVLQELGFAPDPIIRAAGLEPAVVADPANVISFPDCGRLLQTCVAATGCAHFGLLVGQKATTRNFGVVGALMRNAPTLREAILDMCVHQPRYVNGSTVYLMMHDDHALWSYGVHHPGVPALDQVADIAVSVAVSLARELAGTAPVCVLLARRAPEKLAPYVRVFGVTPQFDAEQNAAGFTLPVLNGPVRGGDPAQRRALERQVAEYWAIEQPSVADSVRRFLRARSICCEPMMEDVAAALGQHPRTLSRALQAEGTTYRTLRNTVRLEIARQLLSHTRMSVTGIAHALHYAETSVFTRAFGQWTGLSPREWRAKNT